jgi:predicted phosphodiesterase
MRYAIFSDIHNHTIALEAVLRHAGRQQIDRYFCLGDVGVDECVDLVRNVGALTVFGNWEVSGWRYLSPENRAYHLPPVTCRFEAKLRWIVKKSRQMIVSPGITMIY